MAKAGADPTLMAEQGFADGFPLAVPQAHGVVSAATDNGLAIGTDGHGVDIHSDGRARVRTAMGSPWRFHKRRVLSKLPLTMV
jgi:hypothetical protein